MGLEGGVEEIHGEGFTTADATVDVDAGEGERLSLQRA